ncbi:MAG: HDOD domain-containing protein [Myxococcota bacterium]
MVHSPKSAPSHVPLDLKEEVAAIFGNPGYRPPLLPKTATEVLELSRDPNATMIRIARSLETDPMLAAKVISRVNSAAFRRGQAIRSLKEALTRLGIAGLRDVVVEAALELRVFRVPGFQDAMERLRVHSTKVAEISRLVCRLTHVNSDFAFLCGLLHDIGMAGILLALTAEGPKRKFNLAELWPVIHQSHAVASTVMARAWGFPPDLIQVLSDHHALDVDGHPHLQRAALIVAEDVANRLGWGIQAGERVDEVRPEELVRAKALLSIDSALAARIEQEVQASKSD